MNTLNTIIEEEEKRSSTETRTQFKDDGILYQEPTIYRLTEQEFTSALQRAYEAGEREADAKWERKLEGMKEDEQLMYDTEDDVEYRTYRAGKALDLLHKDIAGIAEKVKLTVLDTLLSKIRS